MTAHLIAVTWSSADPSAQAHFWADLLGRAVQEEPAGPRLAGTADQVGLRFVHDSRPKVRANRIHLHLTSDSKAEQVATVDRALGLGAAHLDVGQRPDEGHIVLADPEGNEFCVIEAGNAYLAGTGFLGEVACDGTREVGLFWSAALEWPLVWDQDEETAVQSPVGGTKVAWGGPPVEPILDAPRQRFELGAVAQGTDAEAARLVALGATRLASRHGALILADPDGNEFVLTGPASA